MKIGDVIDAYVGLKTSFGMSFECARRVLEQFSREIGNPPIGEVQAEAVAAFLRGRGEEAGAVPASFFAAWRAALNFCHSNEAGETLPAGFSRCKARSWPFNCRNEKGTFIFGMTKSV